MGSAFMGNVGQEEDFAAAEAKAYKIGAKKFFLVVRITHPSPSNSILLSAIKTFEGSAALELEQIWCSPGFVYFF